MLSSSNIIANSNIKFGTSGARGLVEDFSSDVCMAYTHAFVSAMNHFNFSRVAIGIDNRPSSPKMAEAIASALRQQNILPVFYGVLPTPALAYKAMADAVPAIMVTGSHIPFDRNGIKFYRPDGEITKQDEVLISQANVDFESIVSHEALSVNHEAVEFYIDRYTSLFDSPILAGKHIGIYEHSSSGRDLYQQIFEALGAKVTAFGRSDKFVPIDTEAVSEEDKVLARNWSKQYQFDAIFSTDGDGDRPLISDENGEWLRGDILGLLTAKALGVDSLALPVSCNTAVEKSGIFKAVVKTKIGSPYVIAEFESLLTQSKNVAGFEANGGFLLASNIKVGAGEISALPTRDAVLPAVMLFALCHESTISQEVKQLPNRFTESDRITEFPLSLSKSFIQALKTDPSGFLSNIDKSWTVDDMNDVDGVRMTLKNNDVIHIRPSGNAPELRCYVESESNSKATKLLERVLEQLKLLK